MPVERSVAGSDLKDLTAVPALSQPPPMPREQPDDDELLERQRNEVELLAGMYPSEFHLVRSAAHAPTSPTSPFFSSSTATASPSPVATLDTDFEFEMHLDPALCTLTVVLPRAAYPTSARPHAFLTFPPTVANATRARLRQRLRAVLDALEVGVECADLVVAGFRDALDEERVLLRQTQVDQPSAAAAAAAADDAGPHADGRAREQEMGRRVVLWMHHLLATGKRRAIVARSSELGLAGFARPGYPGAIYVEGAEGEVKAFVEEIKAMRWQAIQERATQTVPFSSLHLVARGASGIEEVQSLGEIAGKLEATDDNGLDVAAFFLEGMKIK